MLDEFESYLRSSDRSGNTITAYGKDVREFLEFIHSKGVTVHEVDQKTLLGFLAHLTQRDRKDTKRRKMEAVKTFYAAMRKMDELRTDPFDGFEDMPRLEDNRGRALTEIEYRSLRDVWFSTLRGMRVSPLLRNTSTS